MDIAFRLSLTHDARQVRKLASRLVETCSLLIVSLVANSYLPHHIVLAYEYGNNSGGSRLLKNICTKTIEKLTETIEKIPNYSNCTTPRGPLNPTLL